MGWKGSPKPQKRGKPPKRDKDTQTYIMVSKSRGVRVDKPVQRAQEQVRSKRELRKLQRTLSDLEKHAKSLYPGSRAHKEALKGIERFKEDNEL